MLKKLFTIFLFLFALTSVYSQLGKIHYVPPLAGQECWGSHDLHLNTKHWIHQCHYKTNWRNKNRLGDQRTIKNDEPWDFSTGTGRGI